MRKIARVDETQKEIVQSLRRVGAFVEDIHTLGKGAPDILTFFRGAWIPIEIKKSNKEKLTPDEVAWWRRAGIFPIIAWDQSSAFKAIGLEAHSVLGIH